MSLLANVTWMVVKFICGCAKYYQKTLDDSASSVKQGVNPNATSIVATDGMPSHLVKSPRMASQPPMSLSVLRPLVNIVGRVPLRTVAKWLVCLVFLLNVRSWPLMWHYRVFEPVFRIRLQYWLVQLRSTFKSRKGKAKAIEQWFDSLTPVGADPFEMTVSYHAWASIDDSDFNGHLSNSSYAKTLDSARFKSALAMFPQFFQAGGWMPLAATHFNFIREIPMFASYEVRVSIASWDQKWLYVITKFVSSPKKGKGQKGQQRQIRSEQTPTPPPTAGPDALFHASLRTPSDAISTSDTPLPSVMTPPHTSKAPTPETATALTAVAASLASSPTTTTEPDGSIVHSVAVSLCCFKVGRITVPPALVIALNGFANANANANAPSPLTTTPTDTLASGERFYSISNPPPHWHTAKQIMSASEGGSTKRLRELLKGGWKDVPEGQRWWDDALGGDIEARRLRRLEVVKSLAIGMSGARELS